MQLRCVLKAPPTPGNAGEEKKKKKGTAPGRNVTSRTDNKPAEWLRNRLTPVIHKCLYFINFMAYSIIN